jgi:hypothetical protein
MVLNRVGDFDPDLYRSLSQEIDAYIGLTHRLKYETVKGSDGRQSIYLVGRVPALKRAQIEGALHGMKAGFYRGRMERTCDERRDEC